MPQKPNKNIALTGFMAVGKTVVGKKLAQRLKRPFVDLDSLIEKQEGMKIHAIFDTKGEKYFRKVEKQLLNDALREDGKVIATGGGVVTDAESLRLLKERSVLICLSAPPEILLRRSGSGAKRPLLEDGNRLRRIEELLRQREAAYAQAHLHIETATLSVKKIVDKIASFVATNRS